MQSRFMLLEGGKAVAAVKRAAIANSQQAAERELELLFEDMERMYRNRCLIPEWFLKKQLLLFCNTVTAFLGESSAGKVDERENAVDDLAAAE